MGPVSRGLGIEGHVIGGAEMMAAGKRTSRDRQTVAVLTTSRAEYYQMRPVLRAIQRSRRLELKLLVSGTHLAANFGKTERDIAADGYAYERVPILLDDDSLAACAGTAGLAVQGVGCALDRMGADLLMVLGDRYEVLAAVVGATCVGVPVAHLHGGERTDGAVDDVCRHAISKLSALHFVTTDVYRQRVMQMGEPPERVHRVGAPFLDEILAAKLCSRRELERVLKIRLARPMALVCYHPATREKGDPGTICRTILERTAARCASLVISGPNSDPGNASITRAITAFVRGRRNVAFGANLGSRIFLSAMAHCDVMVGNSSSGIHEAASFQTPVVNVGSRQAGRLRPRNVIDCGNGGRSIDAALAKSLSAEFPRTLSAMVNPYGDGLASRRIVGVLQDCIPFKRRLAAKVFADGPAVLAAAKAWGTGDGH